MQAKLLGIICNVLHFSETKLQIKKNDITDTDQLNT
jgi:hypothetical protein